MRLSHSMKKLTTRLGLSLFVIILIAYIAIGFETSTQTKSNIAPITIDTTPKAPDVYSETAYNICKYTIVLFDINTTVMLNEQTIECIKLFKYAIDTGIYTTITVTGCASQDGPVDNRLPLALLRAEYIKSQLVNQGISKDVIIVKTMDNPTDECPWVRSLETKRFSTFDPKSPSALINSRSAAIVGN